jgi:O-antigen ligase
MILLRIAAGLASATLFVLLLSLGRIEDLPVFGAAAVLALVPLAAWRSDYGLRAVAMVLPISSWVGRGWTSYGLMWPTAVLLAFACGYLAHAAVGRRTSSDPQLRASVLTMAAIVGASLAVQIAVLLERFGRATFMARVARLGQHDFFVVNMNWEAVTAAVLIFAGLILFYAAARAVGQSPATARGLCRAVVIGAVAAASINVWRIIAAAVRDQSPLLKFVELLQTQRLNEHYDDVNAAGSYFVLTLCIAIALARKGKGWIVAVTIIAAALWLTSSRTAIVAGLLAAALPLLVSRMSAPEPSTAITRSTALGPGKPDAGAARGISNRMLVRGGVIVGALAIVATVTVMLMPERGFQQSPSTALQVRLGLARAAMGMVVARPVFGVGIGEFYQRSGEFSSEELKRLFPRARNENAHNNFLQILAELGIVGMVGLLWILGLAVRRAWRLVRSTGQPDTLAVGVMTGVTAFVLSWLAGHPLLIPEAAGTFWLALGIVAGLGAPTAPVTQHEHFPFGRLVAGACLLLALTVPVRARQQIADSNLEHVGIGLSGWHRTEDNLAYRKAGPECAVFVPADAPRVTVPLRAASSGAVLDVELRLDGRLANIVHVESDRWTAESILMPIVSNGPRFRKLELRVLNAPIPTKDGSVLLIGKVLTY